MRGGPFGNELGHGGGDCRAYGSRDRCRDVLRPRSSRANSLSKASAPSHQSAHVAAQSIMNTTCPSRHRPKLAPLGPFGQLDCRAVGHGFATDSCPKHQICDESPDPLSAVRVRPRLSGECWRPKKNRVPKPTSNFGLL